MSSIPSWLYVLIKLAIQLASPAILELVKKYASTLPAELVDIIDDFIDSLLNPKVSNSVAKKAALGKLRECQGVGCAPKLKK